MLLFILYGFLTPSREHLTFIQQGIYRHFKKKKSTPPLFIEVPMQRQESELSYICVRSIDFAFVLQFCNWILELCRQCVFFVFVFMVYTPFYRVFHVVSIDMSLTVTIYLVCF